MFTQEQFQFQSHNPTEQIQGYFCFDPEIEPIAIVQISHGMSESFAAYQEVAEYLVSKGFFVAGNDHLGHGNTVKSRDDLGYFAPKNGNVCLVEDVRTLQQLTKKQHPTLPYCLLGHSMGSFIARCYLHQYSDDIDLAVLSGTGGKNPLLPLGIAITKVISTFRPRVRSHVIRSLTGLTVTYDQSYDPRYDWLTHDHAIMDEYAAKESESFIFTSSAYYDLFLLYHHASAKHWGDPIRKDLPIYFFSGDEDPVGGFGKGVRKLYDRVLAQGFSDAQCKIYKHGRHEMLKETNREEVFEDLHQWMISHIKTTQKSL